VAASELATTNFHPDFLDGSSLVDSRGTSDVASGRFFVGRRLSFVFVSMLD